MKRGEISHVQEVNKPCSVLLKDPSVAWEQTESLLILVALRCSPEQRTLEQDVA